MKTLLSGTEHSRGKFLVLLNPTKLQVVFPFVFISSLWLVLSGFHNPGIPNLWQ